jgi:hypothetical protein
MCLSAHGYGIETRTKQKIRNNKTKKGRNGLPYVAERLETGFRCPSDLDRCVNVAKIFEEKKACLAGRS